MPRCRTCGVENESLLEIIQCERDMQNDITAKIEQYLHFKVCDGKICYPCLSQIVSWDEFYKNAIIVNESWPSKTDESLDAFISCKYEIPVFPEVMDKSNEEEDVTIDFNSTNEQFGKFMCQLCGHRFNYKHTLRKHVEMHATRRKFSCAHCGMDFPDRRRCLKHVKNVHAIFDSVANAKIADDRIKEFRGIKQPAPRNCRYCERSFGDEIQLVAHVKDAHSDQVNYECDECPASFYLEGDYADHVRKKHPGVKTCPYCSLEFHSPAYYARHLMLHLKGYACGLCRRICRSKKDLTEHELSVHPEVRPFKCHHCGKSFKQKPHFKEHERLHTGERPFSCDLCGRTFSKRFHLKGHISRQHTGEKPYICDICGCAFTLQRDMHQHKRLHFKTSSDIKTVAEKLCIDELSQF